MSLGTFVWIDRSAVFFTLWRSKSMLKYRA